MKHVPITPSRIAAAVLFSGFLALGNASAVLVEFTAAEGYVNGTLNNQPPSPATPVWSVSADADTPFAVDSSGGGSVSFNTGLSNRTVGYNQSLDFSGGAVFTTYIEFNFVQSIATVVATTTAAGILYQDTVSSGSVAGTLAGFGRTTVLDGYRLAFASGAVNIAGTSLGINSGASDFTSDLIRMTLTLQQGGSSSTWIGTETIYNVTTGTQVATRSSSAISIGAADPASFFGAMQLGGGMTASGLSSFNVLAYSSPVPEPTTWGMIALGGTVLMALRRRRQS